MPDSVHKCELPLVRGAADRRLSGPLTKHGKKLLTRLVYDGLLTRCDLHFALRSSKRTTWIFLDLLKCLNKSKKIKQRNECVNSLPCTTGFAQDSRNPPYLFALSHSHLVRFANLKNFGHSHCKRSSKNKPNQQSIKQKQQQRNVLHLQKELSLLQKEK